MGRVAVKAIGEILRVSEEFFMLEAEEDSDGEVDGVAAEKKERAVMGSMVGMLGEWTDARKVVVLDNHGRVGEGEEATGGNANNDVQLSLAESVLERLLGPGCHAKETKHLLSLLGKLYIPTPPASASAVKPPPEALERAARVKSLLDEAITEGVATDAAGKNHLVKTKNAVLKFLQGVGMGAAAAAAGSRSGSARKSGSAVRAGSSGEEPDQEPDPEEEEEEEGPEQEDTEEVAAVLVVREHEHGDGDEVGDGDATTTRMMETLELGASGDDDLL